ncbi:hypothetical protein XO10_00645 [Marinitoga sp. 1135]|uniref:Phage protein, HK97 gp10 family n=1 Tax=Marinitoga piezophila (strain DSM 14283 / JCM 11233 / KA3) TaxID=443254 RepID=H2J4C4_MARPK|nr:MULTISPECIES: hypothetical protein [Marinitoga]AEX84779.1 hypothetical protein Marpi_0329 [Marinitoga piezophila KA3]NUU94826.1 hypothetical protein [Marinitoga sp. 1135]NUU96761.1 hypothetical protein [Marinitoga sp. 1138]
MKIEIVGDKKLNKRLKQLGKNLGPSGRRKAFGIATSLLANYLKLLYDKELNSSKIKNKVFTEVSTEHGKVYTDQIHAIFLEYGTKAHDIFPKRKKALSWYIGPKPKPQGYMGDKKYWAVAKHVRHPGTKGKYFFARTLKDNKEKILTIFKKGMMEDV